MKNPEDKHYEVDNPEIKLLLREIGLRLSSSLPRGWGFTLLLFEFGEKGSLFYISDANREDMIKTLDEFKVKLLEHTDVKGKKQ